MRHLFSPTRTLSLSKSNNRAVFEIRRDGGSMYPVWWIFWKFPVVHLPASRLNENDPLVKESGSIIIESSNKYQFIYFTSTGFFSNMSSSFAIGPFNLKSCSRRVIRRTFGSTNIEFHPIKPTGIQHVFFANILLCIGQGSWDFSMAKIANPNFMETLCKVWKSLNKKLPATKKTTTKFDPPQNGWHSMTPAIYLYMVSFQSEDSPNQLVGHLTFINPPVN